MKLYTANITEISELTLFIMNLADFNLNVVSSVTRNIPYFRGLGTLARKFNSLSIKLGANPIVKAKMKDKTSILVDIRSNTEVGAFYLGEYDSILIKIICSLLDPNSCFLDIGANIGFYTISIGNFIRQKKGSGKIIAFEPFEGNYKRLLDNLKINNLDNFCLANKYGLSNEFVDSLLTLREDFFNGSSTGNAAIPTNVRFDKEFSRVPIKLERLDDIWQHFCDKCGKIDIVKMDIEGHEDLCLQGGQKTIEKHRPTILMEVNKPYYDARDIKLDNTFLSLIPDKYFIFRQVDAKWKQINSLDECSKIDNVFLIAEEKLNSQSYKIFHN